MKGGIYEACLEMASCGIIYVTSFVIMSTSVETILRFSFSNSERSDFGITDGRDSRNVSLR
jgi:hypothetical protein